MLFPADVSCSLGNWMFVEMLYADGLAPKLGLRAAQRSYGNLAIGNDL